MPAPKSLTRVFVDVKNADIVLREFPVREDLTGILNIDNGSHLPRADYNAVVKAYDRLDPGARSAFSDLAKTYIEDKDNFPARNQALHPDIRKSLADAGLSLRDKDLRIVHDHVHKNGKGYNTQIINVAGSNVNAQAAPQEISMAYFRQNVYEAKRLSRAFAEGAVSDITRALIQDLNLPRAHAEEKAQEILRHPLRDALSKRM